jgi:hypothetical protein
LKPNTFAWEEYSNHALRFSLNRLFSQPIGFDNRRQVGPIKPPG